MKINEVAKLTGITIRTLHYYDEIGLLKPSEITGAGYRLYDENSLSKLQQILFFRELEFPLNEIKEIMRSSQYDTAEALKRQKELLIKKRERIDKLITLVENTIKGEGKMSFEEFDMTEIEESKKKYAKEVKERFGGSDAYIESEKKTSNYGREEWQKINDECKNILKAFADNRDKAPESKEVQELVKEWQLFITESFYNCTNDILRGLGYMYVEDERFKKNIDSNGEGTAEFISKAIKIYCEK
ncbi:DNA-binding transcriptional MerR regulator [Clostridium acetobutylicum]|uniref:Transcriptional regulator, merR family n=1 Tax=Clostridium acetobutylicum (strain ATCC 824 / DSM 792 / JCM 1419 / IAM 19013 / LMG 5710 / NBRC 13948 / NRRL B-527 / VKM B-1787 / 2291 / W) TaxID=272562 RepID=Q97DK1_CLOAB|nr:MULTISPECIES: MerR family transcriptional regulator [Clostridium]AAK81402.1 Transcriptional regulator, merR family [Clostridium acetobutylicum ATCC 824]ADZ22516.1 Transcriptional regulator, merR family [Clostridium acetobutylicum EA 2018]AEI32871.1 MerR family transcriptional regulator [Clostridium acetobutylicum DSM 1731]AWV80929.1 MerR family transcriptional regulator [Clostridium acetobutylicum]MBC2393748.1 MerR family transcriptional regulator [Clostridium acetobutylicum]